MRQRSAERQTEREPWFSTSPTLGHKWVGASQTPHTTRKQRRQRQTLNTKRTYLWLALRIAPKRCIGWEEGGKKRRGYKSEKRENTNRPSDIFYSGFKREDMDKQVGLKSGQSLGCTVSGAAKRREAEVAVVEGGGGVGCTRIEKAGVTAMERRAGMNE